MVRGPGADERLEALEDEALEWIARALEDHPGAWVAVSGGKDSTAVAHLARRVDRGVPLVFYDSGAEFPQTLEWIRALGEHWGGLHVVRAEPDAVTKIESEGWLTGRPLGGKDRASRSLHRTLITEPEAKARQELGCDWNLLGLRADESPGRRLALASGRGVITRHHPRSSGGAFLSGSLNPIWRWNPTQVHDYLRAHRVPLNPLYHDLERLGVNKQHSRVSLMLDGNCLRRGRWALTYRLAPNQARKIEARLPQLRAFR